jgi:Arc/MetJ family transcription regulator
MKTTLNISEKLLEEAIRLTGVRTKTAVVSQALEALIREKRIDRLIKKAGNLNFDDSWEESRHGR